VSFVLNPLSLIHNLHPMIGLSAVIITFNEEKNIDRCLASLHGIADEIIVVDSFSTDRTKEICAKYGVKFFEHKFEGHIQQKNHAASLATFDHILSIDADEALSEELKNEIKRVKSDWKNDGYYVNRLTNYCGKWIRHCGWYPDRKLRLFKKDKGKWAGFNPHDKLELHDASNTSRLDGDLLHYSYYTIEDHISQVNKFTTIGAEVAWTHGERSNIVKIIFKPGIRFLRDYIFHLGFLDGFYGFVICRISSDATFVKYVKLYRLQKAKS
jgi:glycosyltransferase involved in cell wall biosynthesis